MSRQPDNRGSCKYGAECGLRLACECDCCLDAHPCECEDDDSWEPDYEYDDPSGGLDAGAKPGGGR